VVQSYDIVAVQPMNQKVFLVSNSLIFTPLCLFYILCLKVKERGCYGCAAWWIKRRRSDGWRNR